MKSNMSKMYMILLLLAAVACGKKSESASSEAGDDEWPAMDSFHMIMAEAYHPYKDSANVEPVRRMAEEMAKAAEDWQKQPLPEKVNTDEVKAQLGQLATGARTLSDRIKAGATDEEIGAALTTLHESFHAITEAWHGSMEKHEH
jgi:hypothetical protein